MSRSSGLDADARRAVESFVAEWVTDNDVPSASVAIVDGDEVAYLDAFGARDLEANAPATPDTLYGVASITKSVAATGVLQLVDGDRVALDDPVTEHVEFFAGSEDPPTVHELLSHSSGMPSDGSSVAMTAQILGEGAETAPLGSDADFRRHVEQSLGERADGERFFYYNTGYAVLGKLIEAVDGRPFPEYVDDEVLAPLGMDRSVVRADPAEYDDAMTPYLSREDGPERADYPVKGVGAAGGLLSSARDLAAYLRFAMRGDESVVPASLLERAQSAHATRRAFLDGAEETYGYGWMRRPFLGDDLVGHSGTLSVTSAYLGFLEGRDLGVAVAANTAPDVHPMHVGPALLALVEGEDPAEAVPFYALRAKCERVAGEYESYRSVATAEVKREGAGISVTVDTALGGETLTARPASLARGDLAFEAVGAAGDRVPVTFEPTDDGDLDLFVRRWRLHPVE
ncbi:serine hydrolase [Halobacterium litoreum]|uniref:Serine hydrolase n=1 Tax=Halobacterium litoreum TaxID=2039234 RepID=A0ABD5NDG0_9EURY|nr:serine hydrolase [Halobacterium litoreum]UHH14138.1 serine hydrolase [Halobacterium litoreum]